MKILGGSWAEGSAVFDRSMKGISGIKMGGWAGVLVPAEDVISATPVTNENKTSVVGKASWGVAGGMLLGPVGALAGILGGGNKQQLVVAMEFTGDRRALLECDPADLKRLMAMAINRSVAAAGTAAVTNSAPATRGMGFVLKVFLGVVGLLVALVVIGAIVGASDKKKGEATASSGQPSSDSTHADSGTGPATNDAELLIQRCGTPDSDTSTENDNPRPLVPTRLITYKRARLMFAYAPGGGAKAGSPPPYKWELIGIKDTKTDKAIAEGQLKKTITGRLPCFLPH